MTLPKSNRIHRSPSCQSSVMRIGVIAIFLSLWAIVPRSAASPPSDAVPANSLEAGTSASNASGESTSPKKQVSPPAATASDNQPMRILLDAVHSNTWIGTPPQADCYDYHTLHGLARGVGLLKQLGHDVRVQLVAPWRDEDLEICDTIILNLVSMDRPPFLVSEIERIKRFLEGGGGMLIITDHSNCYYHGHILTPLLDSLGIKIPLVTACDEEPYTMGHGNAWISVSDFEDHPMMKGIKHIAFQAGGCVDSRYSVAWTSSQGWGDLNSNPRYGEGGTPGLYGDFIQTAFEPRGKQAVVLAKSVGQGRLAIIADQNAVGGMFLSYADNRQLWLQSVLWTAGRSLERALADLELPDANKHVIWCYEPLTANEYRFGNDDPHGLYNFYGWLTRYYDARARELPTNGLRLAVVAMQDLFTKPEVNGDRIKQLLRAGTHVVVLSETATPAESDLQEFVSKQNDIDAIVKELAMQPVNAKGPLVSKAFESDGLGQFIFILDSELRNSQFSSPERKPKEVQQALENRLLELFDALVPAFRPQPTVPRFSPE
jgi:hypothetical protein